MHDRRPVTDEACCTWTARERAGPASAGSRLTGQRIAVLALALAATVLTGFPAPSRAEPIAPDRIRVVDGDTIRLRGVRKFYRKHIDLAPNARPLAKWESLLHALHRR
jgi:endonuclease YncB( thermonuclease family)